MSVAEILALYAESHGPETTAPERIGYAIAALLPWWGEASLSEVTNATCRRYARDRKNAIGQARAERRAAVEVRYRAKGKEPPPGGKRGHGSDETVRRELTTLRAAINWWEQEGLLTRSPCVWLPDKSNAREQWLTRKQAADLIRAARRLDRSSKYLPLFILLALYTGARKEAILKLQWEEKAGGGFVDLDRNLIDFRKPGQGQTAKRRSVIPIPARLRPFLFRARQRTRTYVLEYRAPTTEELKRGIVAIPVSDPKKAFMKAASAAGLPDSVTPHALRHTAVSWLVQSGVPLWEVSQWVGMSVEMIERVYGHHAPDRFGRVLAAQG